MFYTRHRSSLTTRQPTARSTPTSTRRPSTRGNDAKRSKTRRHGIMHAVRLNDFVSSGTCGFDWGRGGRRRIWGSTAFHSNATSSTDVVCMRRSPRSMLSDRLSAGHNYGDVRPDGTRHSSRWHGLTYARRVARLTSRPLKPVGDCMAIAAFDNGETIGAAPPSHSKPPSSGSKRRAGNRDGESVRSAGHGQVRGCCRRRKPQFGYVLL